MMNPGHDLAGEEIVPAPPALVGTQVAREPGIPSCTDQRGDALGEHRGIQQAQVDALPGQRVDEAVRATSACSKATTLAAA